MPTSVADARRPGPTLARPAAPLRRLGRPAAPAPTSAAPALTPAAASTLVPAWLHGASGPARVVAVFDRAAYLLREDEVLPVLAPGALALPGGLRVARPAHLHGLRLRVGDDVVVGGGEVLTAHGGLVVRRTWRPWSVPAAELPAGARERALAALAAIPDLTDDLPMGVVRAACAVAPAAPLGGWRAADLVGLGPGLTPAGDDLLCGMLLGLRATGRDDDRASLERAVTRLLGRTTALSATLLRQAAAGYAVPTLVDLLHAWHRDAGADELAELTAEVAAIGHTSGRALLLGLQVVLAGHRAAPVHRAIPAPHAIPALTPYPPLTPYPHAIPPSTPREDRRD